MTQGGVRKAIQEFAEQVRSFIYSPLETRDEAAVRTSVEKLWRAHPWVRDILLRSSDLEDARNRLYGWVVERERAIRARKLKAHPLEWSTIREAGMVMRNILSKRCERMAGFSSLECLTNMAHERWAQLPRHLSPAFFEEFHRLFFAVQGRSGIYDSRAPAHTELMGRESAHARSDELDSLAESAEAFIGSYATGLDDDVIEMRQINRKRLQKLLGATSRDWNDYRWQLKHVIRDEKALGRLVTLTKSERDAIRLAKRHHIPFGVTPYYCSLMDEESHRADDHAVRAQVIPSMFYVKQMVKHRERGMHSADFMMEAETSPVDAVTRRYPRVAIFKPFNTCAQICVYCQRNWEIEDVLCEQAFIGSAKMEAAFRWFESHPMVREVLVTGGDAFIMSDEKLNLMLKRFSGMKHIERIRFGTRTPVVLPQRMTPTLISILTKYFDPPRLDIALVTHFEHAYEVSPEALKAVRMVRDAGMSVYNQMVFTVENSRRFEAVATRLALKRIGVDPYYTFIMKGKKECSEMRVPIARALQEMKEEARLMPGTVRLDETVYNVPRLGKNNIRAWQHHDIIMIMPDGSRMIEFHPWEKNISLVDVYIERDVPIYDYLMELARRGEDVREYESMWYYY